MANYAEILSTQTQGEGDIVDLTGQVNSVVERSGVQAGICTVFLPGSTAAITTLEFEPGLQKDLPLALERLFPRGIRYHHQDTWQDGNGHSHVRASVLGPGITVPVAGGRLVLGTWQQIVLVECDVRKRKREIHIQLLGE